VLFIHALSNTADGWSVGLIARLLAASVGLVVLFAVINVIAQRLPLRPLFIVTSGFLFVTAIKLIGDAMQEFQEQRIVPYTEIAAGSWLSALGLKPTLEAVSVQAAVFLLAAATVVVLEWRARHSSDSLARPTQASS
jgi:high-affinity iron transporter